MCRSGESISAIAEDNSKFVRVVSEELGVDLIKLGADSNLELSGVASEESDLKKLDKICRGTVD